MSFQKQHECLSLTFMRIFFLWSAGGWKCGNEYSVIQNHTHSGINNFKSFLTVFFGQAWLTSHAFFQRCMCFSYQWCVYLNVSEKEIFNIVLKVQIHVQKVKHQLHVQSWNGAKSITRKKVRLFLITGKTKDYINDV